jgi:uncharacterized protein (DUF1778 family)
MMHPQFSLEARAARCIEHASGPNGQPVMLVVTEAELPKARKLVGDAPCIVATPADAQRFLIWLKKPANARQLL